MIAAVGDAALVESPGELKLVGPRGLLARFELPANADHDPDEPFFGEILGQALLADPPRFALLRATGRRVQRRVAYVDESWVEIFDATSGQLHLRVDAPVRSLVGFDPSGTLLFGNGDGGLLVVDDGGAVRPLDHEGPPVRGLAFSRDGRRAVGFSRARRVLAVEVDGDRTALAWSRPVDALAAVVSGDGARALVLEREGPAQPGARERRALGAWDVGSGEREAVVARVDAPRGAGPVRGLWADAALGTAALLDDDGTLTAMRAGDRGWRATSSRLGRELEVDVERGRILEAGVGVYLRDLDGALLRTSGYATRMCFAGTGPACVLLGGAVHVLDETGAHVVDGPANLVEVAPHPRGVVALDEQERAHVVDV